MHNQDFAKMTLGEIAKLPGVEDLRPTVKCRGKFALAPRAEAQGDHERADRLLNEAIEAEESLA